MSKRQSEKKKPGGRLPALSIKPAAGELPSVQGIDTMPDRSWSGQSIPGVLTEAPQDAQPAAIQYAGKVVLLTVAGIIVAYSLLEWSVRLSTTGEAGHIESSRYMGWALLASLAIGVVILIVSTLNRPKGLAVDREGVVIGTRLNANSLLYDASFAAWECLKEVKIVEEQTLFARRHRVNLVTDGGEQMSIGWQDLARSMDPGEFFNAVRTWAPDALRGSIIPALGAREKAASYTQLWLKYFSTPARRERVTALADGVALCGGKYAVVGRIGQGGQGTAYLALSSAAGSEEDASICEVVLKEYILPVHRGTLVLQQTAQKLEREAAVLRGINHPQIVRLIDHFVEDHRGYLVMEYIEGKPLKDLVVLEGPQKEQFVVNVAVQVAGILSYLHGLDPPVIHRDLTPDNLIIESSGLIKLVDFNVAHRLESGATATVVGKHCYIPPEQFRGKPTPQSDVYALGCTMYYLLTGEEPEPISASSPRLKAAHLSEQVDRIVLKATAVDTRRRYASAGEMMQDLERLAGKLGAYNQAQPSGGSDVEAPSTSPS